MLQMQNVERLCCRITLQDDDPRWVGAWWVGYLALMVATLLIAPVFFGYPPEPPTSLYWSQLLSYYITNVIIDGIIINSIHRCHHHGLVSTYKCENSMHYKVP